MEPGAVMVIPPVGFSLAVAGGREAKEEEAKASGPEVLQESVHEKIRLCTFGRDENDVFLGDKQTEDVIR